jgi:hypothetical protein
MNREAILQEALEVGFDGQTFFKILDGARLTGQLGRVYDLMRCGAWMTLREIAEACGGSEGGCAARLRDLRKDRFGGFAVERKRSDRGGLWLYRLRLDKNPRLHGVEVNSAIIDEPMTDSANLQIAIEALQTIAQGRGAELDSLLPRWAKMQALAVETLHKMGQT